jgi:hypothetical protein
LLPAQGFAIRGSVFMLHLSSLVSCTPNLEMQLVSQPFGIWRDGFFNPFADDVLARILATVLNFQSERATAFNGSENHRFIAKIVPCLPVTLSAYHVSSSSTVPRKAAGRASVMALRILWQRYTPFCNSRRA